MALSLPLSLRWGHDASHRTASPASKLAGVVRIEHKILATELLHLPDKPAGVESSAIVTNWNRQYLFVRIYPSLVRWVTCALDELFRRQRFRPPVQHSGSLVVEFDVSTSAAGAGARYMVLSSSWASGEFVSNSLRSLASSRVKSTGGFGGTVRDGNQVFRAEWELLVYRAGPGDEVLSCSFRVFLSFGLRV